MITNQNLSTTSPAAPGTATFGPVTHLDKFETLAIAATLTGATGGTLDVYIQMTPDNGQTWVDIVHFAQVAAAAPAATFLVQMSRTTGAATIQSTGDAKLAVGTALNGEWGDQLRAKFVAGTGTTAGAAQTIALVANHLEPRPA